MLIGALNVDLAVGHLNSSDKTPGSHCRNENGKVERTGCRLQRRNDSSVNTIWRDCRHSKCAVRRALEMAGVEFIEENGGGPGLRLRKRPRAKPAKS
jgi:hypothetical protein